MTKHPTLNYASNRSDPELLALVISPLQRRHDEIVALKEEVHRLKIELIEHETACFRAGFTPPWKS